MPNKYNIRPIEDNEDWIWGNGVYGVDKKEDSMICLESIDTPHQSAARVGYVCGYRKSTIEKMKEKGIIMNMVQKPTQEEVQDAWSNCLFNESSEKAKDINLQELGEALKSIGSIQDNNTNDSNWLLFLIIVLLY